MSELEAFYLTSEGWRNYSSGEFLTPPIEPAVPVTYGSGVYGDGVYGGEVD